MKAFVITIVDNERSVEAARRCIISAEKHGTKVTTYPAITPKNTDLKAYTNKHNISTRFFNETYSRTDNCIAAFCSHHSLWQKAVELNEDVLILEHDAKFIQPLPELRYYEGCISFGRPSYGKYFFPSFMGTTKLISKQYFPGAHAYMVSPKAAPILLNAAHSQACPTDLFFHNDRFNFLQEYYPWPIWADDSFTTIQNVKGCVAKHNFGKGYDII